MSENIELSQMGDIAFAKRLKSKRKSKSWTVGEILEANRRGSGFLSDEPSLQSAIRKVHSEFTKNVSEAVKPLEENLKIQANLAKKVSEEFQGIGDVLRKNLVDQANIKDFFDSATISKKLAVQSFAISPGISKLIDAQAEANKRLEVMSQLAISPGISELVEAQSENYRKLISVSQFSITPAISKWVEVQSEAIRSLSLVTQLGTSPGIESLVRASSALASTSSVGRALAQGVASHAEIFKSFSENLNTTRKKLSIPDSPELLNDYLGPRELNLVAKDVGATAPLVIPIVDKVEHIQDVVIIEATKELVRNSSVTNVHLESLNEKMSAGAVSTKLVYVGISAGIAGAIASIAAAIEGAILLFR